MRIAIPVLAIAFVLLAPSVLAGSMQGFDAAFRPVGDKVLAEYTLLGTNSVMLELPSDARSIEVFANGIKVEPNITESGAAKTLFLPDTEKARVDFISSALLEKTEKSFLLANIKTSSAIKNFTARIVLPEGAFLAGPASEAVHPKPDSIESDGQKIIVSWKIADVPEGDSVSLFVVYKESGGSEMFVIALAAFAAVVAAAAVVYLMLRPRKRLEEIAEHLLDSEKAVVDLVAQSREKGIRQRDIQKTVQFSKAKLSRTLRHLQERGVVEIRPHGNTNIITLVKKKQKPKEKGEGGQG